MAKHSVFISFHHANDQPYKDALLRINDTHKIFTDASVNTRGIDERLSDQAIRTKIRDEYLRGSTVTLVLVGTETKNRKHVDWEIYSSMIDGSINKKSGILVITLPTTKNSWSCHTSHGEKDLYPEYKGKWVSFESRSQYEERYPEMPARIIDNLLEPKAKVSVMPWRKIVENPDTLSDLIERTYADRTSCTYDLGRPMRRKNV